MHYTLREASPSDCEPMMRIAHEGLRPYVEQLWGWKPAEYDERFRMDFTPDSISIIQVDAIDVGYYKLEQEDDHAFLAGIYLDSDHRRKGLGTQVISDLIRRFHREKIPLRLRVLTPNPAQQLYLRLGFKVIKQTETHLLMEISDRVLQESDAQPKQ